MILYPLIYSILLIVNSDISELSPNILFLTVDTLRADHLSCYGYQLPLTPNIDRLAQQGIVFENCITEVPLTCPSFSSMLTSQFPRTIGVTRNGLKISKKRITVPEILKKNGYFTFCIQSNWTLKAKLSGLHKGFDIYDDNLHSKRWGIFSSERLADEVTEKAINTLKNRPKNKPFFGWVHYSDPHAPYHFRKDYNLHTEQAKEDKRITKIINYDSEVRFTDEQIGILLQHLPENTTIVFVADHGESLYEHNYLGHGRKLYQNEVRIPFIIVSEGVETSRTNVPVRGIDVGPTLLGIANIQKDRDMLGLDVLKEHVHENRIRVIETYGGAVPKIPIIHLLMKKSGPIMQSVIVNDWKLIVNKSKKELYNILDDPKEEKNVSNKYPDKVLELQKEISKWSKATPILKHKDEEELSSEDLEVLRSMGYLD
ncbi:MAG TPA: sulfatase [Candidatus Hydrogenedens sp.]|nr:sulfatase [Candidatus Hydrogenedens sp.]